MYGRGGLFQFAARADDEAHDLGMVAAERHEIDQGGGAFPGLKMGFENERARPVAPRDAGLLLRRDEPAAVIARAEQRGEASFRIEPRPAQPGDRSVARDQR